MRRIFKIFLIAYAGFVRTGCAHPQKSSIFAGPEAPGSPLRPTRPLCGLGGLVSKTVAINPPSPRLRRTSRSATHP